MSELENRARPPYGRFAVFKKEGRANQAAITWNYEKKRGHEGGKSKQKKKGWRGK